MGVQQYQQMCMRYKGRAVEIRTKDGKAHRGIIQHVDHRRVYIQPMDRRRSLGGFGYGFWGPGWGVAGFGIGIALGSIATLALIPWGFW